MNTPEPSYSPEELVGLVPDIRYDNVFKAIFIFADTAYLHCFPLYDPVRKISLGGHIRVFTLELSKVKKIAQNKSVRKMMPAERWAAYFLYNADESVFARRLIKKIAKEEESVKMATEVMRTFSEDEKKYYLLLSQMKYEMDHCNLMIDAEERGEERGREDERRKSEAVIADKDAALADKDSIIADKDAEISRLRAMLGEGKRLP
jgi:hypothetical protein